MTIERLRVGAELRMTGEEGRRGRARESGWTGGRDGKDGWGDGKDGGSYFRERKEAGMKMAARATRPRAKG